jgi:hypothetical protein
MRKFAVFIMVVVAAVCFTHRSSGQATALAPLQVFTNGPGRISPLHAGQLLEVWGTYSMLATPDPGFAFQSWEWMDVFIKTTRITNSTGGISTNIEKFVTSKQQFFTTPELSFVVQPVFETVQSDVLSTASTYGWQANFGPVREPVEPDVYRTLPAAAAEESGDHVPNGSRIVPWSATLTFDFSATPPSLTAVIPNAVLEGGQPFPLTVRSYYGYQLTNGTFRFSGDYLRDTYPTGSQYGFNWEFSTPTKGTLVWNGTASWMGGHFWSLSVSNLTLFPLAQLSITRVGTAAVQASWRTNFSDLVLESAPSLPAADWSPVTNAVTPAGNRYSVTLDMDAPQRFYRLRKP